MQPNQYSPRFFSAWYKIALFNLLLVALIGSILRFKMVASLPWVNHKYFLHGHSHFAFSGWISLVLMVAIIQRIEQSGSRLPTGLFKKVLLAHLFTAYGMLLTFPFQGYAFLSICFSTASILVSYVFVANIWRYCNAINWGPTASMAIRAALAFLVISSLGAFALAGLMASHAQSQPLYFSALYFFLHFQYNGWFFFAIAGLWIARFPGSGKGILHPGIKGLVIACFPAAILSGLWMDVPGWVYILSGVIAIVQLVATLLTILGLKAGWSVLAAVLSNTEKWLLKLSFAAALIRILLQALSTIPMLSRFAFAYRPVVIGYLHLILLGCISLFLLSWLFGKGLWQKHPGFAVAGLALFLTGFLGTEGTLMMQGLGYIGWVSIPYTNEVLFVSALLMFSGIFTLFGAARLPEAVPQ